MSTRGCLCLYARRGRFVYSEGLSSRTPDCHTAAQSCSCSTSTHANKAFGQTEPAHSTPCCCNCQETSGRIGQSQRAVTRQQQQQRLGRNSLLVRRICSEPRFRSQSPVSCFRGHCCFFAVSGQNYFIITFTYLFFMQYLEWPLGEEKKPSARHPIASPVSRFLEYNHCAPWRRKPAAGGGGGH